MNMSKPVKAAFALLFLLAAVAPTQAAIIQFDLFGKIGAGLRTGNEAPTVPATGGSGGEIGSGIVFDNVTLQLSINIAWGSGNGFTDLTGNATAGHIHQPTPSLPPAGFNEATGVLIGLNTLPGWNPSATIGGFNGTITLTAVQAQQLMEGRFYINVHTATNGGGEIRGTMLPVPEPATVSLVALSAVGFVLLRLRARRG